MIKAQTVDNISDYKRAEASLFTSMKSKLLLLLQKPRRAWIIAWQWQVFLTKSPRNTDEFNRLLVPEKRAGESISQPANQSCLLTVIPFVGEVDDLDGPGRVGAQAEQRKPS